MRDLDHLSRSSWLPNCFVISAKQLPLPQCKKTYKHVGAPHCKLVINPFED
jgi:hypothetical protein